VVEAEPLPMVEAEAAPMVEAEAAPMVEAEPLPMVEAEAAPMVEAEPLPMVEAEAAPMVEAEPLPAFQGEAGPVDEPVPMVEAQPLSPSPAAAMVAEEPPHDAGEPMPTSAFTVDGLPAAAASAQPAGGPSFVSELATGVGRALPPVASPPVAAPAYDLRREFAGVIEQVSMPEANDLPPAVDLPGPVGTLRSMLAELLDPANRETVTLLVLRFASVVFERAALFLVTRRAYLGLGGFSIEESSDRFVVRVRRIQVPVGIPSVFDRVVRYRAGYRGLLERVEGNQRLIEGMGGSWPASEVAAMPLVSNDRVAAVLYGDNPRAAELAPTATLEIFLQQAGLAMERVLLERKLEEARRATGDGRDR
jgi:hypothetical protein